MMGFYTFFQILVLVSSIGTFSHSYHHYQSSTTRIIAKTHFKLYFIPPSKTASKHEEEETIELSNVHDVIPTSLASSNVNMVLKYAGKIDVALAAILCIATVSFGDGKSIARAESIADVNNYNDNNFRLVIPPSWFILPRKTPTPSMMQYQVEESLLVASSLAEGASLSVTRTNAARLLKDFDIEWWFAPIEKLQDVGSPDIIAKLLILQRQGEFEKKQTASSVQNVEMYDDSTAASVSFDFTTPVAVGVNRKTLTKTLLKNGSLYTIWISALESVVEGDYSKALLDLRDSFTIK